MKISEIASPLLTFIATVRVVLCHSTVIARTVVIAVTSTSAKAHLAQTYGVENILSLTLLSVDTAIGEQVTSLSPSELQVKSMRDRAKQLTRQARQLKARQSLKKAQQNLIKSTQLPRTY